MASILIIDDISSVRTTLRRVLERHGHDIHEAADGRDGLSVFDRSQPDLILLDMLMPEQDGVETLTAIRQRSPDVSIIAMSGGAGLVTSDLLFRTAQLLGADATLAKPFSAEALVSAVNVCLAEDGHGARIISGKA